MGGESHTEETRFFCDLGAMTAEERAKYEHLAWRVSGSGEERRELDNGYAFRLSPQKISLEEVAQWMELERICCPFFDLEVEAEPNDGPIWLRMTGPEGVKEFIRSEIGT